MKHRRPLGPAVPTMIVMARYAKGAVAIQPFDRLTALSGVEGLDCFVTPNRRIPRNDRFPSHASRPYHQLRPQRPLEILRRKRGEVRDGHLVDVAVVIFPVVDGLALQRVERGLHRA